MTPARPLAARLAPVGFGALCLGALAACSSGKVWDRPYVSAAPPRALPAPRAPSGEAEAHLPPPRAPSAVAADDRDTFDAVNRIRAARGLRPFRWNDRIHAAARDHSADQRRCGRMSHGSPDPRLDDLKERLRLSGYEGRQWAEVVAWGYQDVPAVVDGWMNSSGHRKILLDPGLEEAAFARDGDYWTGDFGTPWR